MSFAFQGELTIAQGRIRAIEPRYGVVTLRIGPRRFEFPGAWVFPGFVDAHAHVVGLGLFLREGYLQNAASKEECIWHVHRHGPNRGEWIVARGWNQECWSSSQFPTRYDLDEAFPDIPIALTRVDGHALWVNSCALERAGITCDTVDPVGGRILRDEHGEPTGILLDEAMTLIEQLIPSPTDEDIESAILESTATASRSGLTEIHDMDVHPDDLPIFTRLAEEGKLPCRILSWVRGQHFDWHSAGILPTTGELHRIVGIKLFADGALGSRGAALLEPYTDDETTDGILLLSSEDILHRIHQALEDGFTSVAIHAVGDRAVRSVLDAFELVGSLYPILDHIRLRIEHSQVVHPDDLPRYVRTGAIASVQPIHCISDAVMAERRLGNRTITAYRWRSFLQHGVLLCAGSDFPVESHNPLLGIDAFCRRKPPGSDHPWHPTECLSQLEAIEAYTINAHRAADTNDRRGYLSIDMDADMTILDRNIEACPPEEIIETRTLATVVGGTLYEHV
jgi:hypothetical protein